MGHRPEWRSLHTKRNCPERSSANIRKNRKSVFVVRSLPAHNGRRPPPPERMLTASSLPHTTCCRTAAQAASSTTPHRPSRPLRRRRQNYAFLNPEFGTYFGLRIFKALQEENRVDPHPQHPADEKIKRRLVEVFFPKSALWRNRLLRVESRELREHSPEHLSSVQLPATPPPTKRIPSWMPWTTWSRPCSGAAAKTT